MDLSKLINVTRSDISKYELNDIIPNKETLFKIGKVLNIRYICNDGYTNIIISDFKKKLKYWRLKNNLTISKACKYFNTDKSTYYKWEKGIFNISREKYNSNKALIDYILTL